MSSFFFLGGGGVVSFLIFCNEGPHRPQTVEDVSA